jgi:hypothetical protein
VGYRTMNAVESVASACSALRSFQQPLRARVIRMPCWQFHLAACASGSFCASLLDMRAVAVLCLLLHTCAVPSIPPFVSFASMAITTHDFTLGTNFRR